MILLLVSCWAIAAAVGRAVVLAGGDTSHVAIAVGAVMLGWAFVEGKRRSGSYPSWAVAGTAAGTAVGSLTMVGWLDPLAAAVGVSPVWGHVLAGLIWLVSGFGLIYGRSSG